MQKIKTWKTITVRDGNFQSKDEVLSHLLSYGLIDQENENHQDWRTVSFNYNSDYSAFFKEMFVQIEEGAKEEVELVKLKPIELLNLVDLSEVNYRTICNQAARFGLHPCSQEVPWRLRMELSKTDLNSEIIVASDPFKYAQSLLTLNSSIPKKGYEKGRLLGHRRYAGYSKYLFRSFDELVFCKK